MIATPTKTHYALARRALELGIHTFVEKPLATSREECADLIELADAEQRVLFVGHVFLYSAAVAKLKEIVSRGELGEICYISSTRLNLGPVRRDVNVLWDLAPHDTSIILELMGGSPTSVSCSGLAYLDRNIHDVCNLTMQFPNNRIGMVHVSWLDPHKRRVMTVVGSKKMAVYDDIEPLEKIRIYDNGVEPMPQSQLLRRVSVQLPLWRHSQSAHQRGRAAAGRDAQLHRRDRFSKRSRKQMAGTDCGSSK